MNRKEYEQRSWTHIKRKLPPDTDEILLLWNPMIKEPFLQIGYISHEHAKRILKGQESETLKKFAIDRIFSYWRRVIGPK